MKYRTRIQYTEADKALRWEVPMAMLSWENAASTEAASATESRSRMTVISNCAPPVFPWRIRAMPTYQYHCKKCGKSFERSEHIAEHEKSHPLCPKCRSAQVEPVLAGFLRQDVEEEFEPPLPGRLTPR